MSGCARAAGAAQQRGGGLRARLSSRDRGHHGPRTGERGQPGQHAYRCAQTVQTLHAVQTVQIVETVLYVHLKN